MEESMRESGDRGGAGERLGEALMNAVENRRSGPAAASLDRGSRAFVAAVEGRRERGRAPAERPRLGALVAATALCAAVVLGAAAWPALVSNAQGGSRARVETKVTPAAQAPVTFAHQLIAGPGAGSSFGLGGQWNALSQGGYPGFRGASEWTTSSTSTAAWSLGPTSGGTRWDAVRVQVWVPGQHAGAWVRYTVTATAGNATQSRSFDLAQQTASGWVTVPGTFAVGTPTQRTGAIGVRMTYLQPYAGPAADATCTSAGACPAMAAGQVAFQWS